MAEGPAGETTVAVESDGGIADPGRRGTPDRRRWRTGRIARVALPVTAVEIGDPQLRIRTTTPAGDELTKTITLPVRLERPRDRPAQPDRARARAAA